MSFLFFRISARQQGAWLAETEIQLPEQSLALTNTQLQIVGLLDPSRQSLAVPEIDSHADVTRLVAQHPIDLFHLVLVQAAWPT